MQYSLINDFQEDLERGRCLVVMPVSRLNIEERFSLGDFTLYPAWEVNIEELRILPNDTLESAYGNRILREIQSSIAGINEATFKENVILAFTSEIDWHVFLNANHDYDLRLIESLSRKAEKALDIIRFHFCRIDLPDTLPGSVGTWNGSGSFSGALLYTPFDHEGYLIAGSVVPHIIVKGNGLHLDAEQVALIDGQQFYTDKPGVDSA